LAFGGPLRRRDGRTNERVTHASEAGVTVSLRCRVLAIQAMSQGGAIVSVAGSLVASGDASHQLLPGIDWNMSKSERMSEAHPTRPGRSGRTPVKANVHAAKAKVDAAADASRPARPSRVRTVSGEGASSKRRRHAPIPAAVSDDDVRMLAYFLWLGRQGAPGDPLTDWLEAERLLRG